MFRIIALSVVAIVLSACQSVPHRTMDEMAVSKLKVNDVDLAYVEEGKGETVLFIHGSSGDWRSWDSLRSMISDKYHYVSMSRRYHYPNTWSDDGSNYTLAQHVEDIALFIRTLNVGKVHLVGGSYGGRIAGYLTLKYPELLRSVVISDPSLIAPVSPEGKEAVAAFQKDYAKSVVAAKAGDAKQAAVLLFDAVLDEPGAFEKASPARQQRWLDNAKTLLPQYTGAAPAPITCEQFSTIKIPVLVMSGENSRANFRYGNEMLLSCLPKGTPMAVVSNSPHMWYPVNPAMGAQEILAFIAKH